jgi:hypothetical protein
VRRKRLLAAAAGVLAVGATAAIAQAAPGTETGPSSSQSPVLVRTQPGIVTKSILTTGDSVPKAGGGTYRMVGIPDGLGAYDNGDGTFTLLSNHELPSDKGVVRRHGAKGSFVSKWVINKSDLSVVSGQDLIQTLNVWNGSTWTAASGDAAPNRLNRLCSADLAPISAYYNPATGDGYNGRIFTDGEESDGGRPFGHVVDSGQSYELTPWIGTMSFENVVANPGTTTGDRTASMGLDDGSASVGQQVYFHLGTKQSTGNPVQKAGLANGQLYGIKALGVNQNEYQQAWHVGDQVNFSLVDVSAHAGVPGTGANTLEGDSQAGGVTNFQRPEDGSWDPEHPNDFYFVTTSSFGARPDENRTGETRLWRLHFNDLTDPSQGGKLKLLVSGPVGTADSPSATGTQSAGSPGPQMLDNITVNDRGQVIMLEDVGNQAYRGGVWIYDIGSGSLTEIAIADPDRFTPGAPGFVTKDEEASGVIPAPFLGADAYLLDEQVHKTSSDSELVEGGQYMELHIPPGKKF